MASLIKVTQIQTTADRNPLYASIPVHLILSIKAQLVGTRILAARGQSIDQIDCKESHDEVVKMYEEASADGLAKFLLLMRDTSTMEGREVLFADLVRKATEDALADLAARADAVDGVGKKKK